MDNKMTAEQALAKLLRANETEYTSVRHFVEHWLGGEDKVREMISALSAPRAPAGWIPIDEKLPEIGQLVALMDNSRYCNMPDGLPDMHVTATGFLNEFGNKYWSTFGSSPSADLHGFTHWMPLPNVLAASPEPDVCCTHASLRAEVEALKRGPNLKWPLDKHLQGILGRPCFDCAQYAPILRALGQDIPQKAEAEQAAVIAWMLGHYLADQDNWMSRIADDIDKAARQREGGA